MSDDRFVPLSYYLNPNLFDFIELPEGLLDKIGIVESNIEVDEEITLGEEIEETYYDEIEEEEYNISGPNIEVVKRENRIIFTIANPEDLSFRIPGLDGVELVIVSRDSFNATLAIKEDGSYAFTAEIPFRLRFDRSILKPMIQKTRDDGSTYFEELGDKRVEIDFGRVGVTLDSEGFNFGAGLSFGIDGPVMIGNTGIIMDNVAGLTFNLKGDGDKPENAPEGWKGIYVGSADVYIPDVMSGSIRARGLGIGSGGFYGRIEYEHPLTYNEATNEFEGDANLVGKVMGMKGGLSSIALEFVQNIPVEVDIKGKILIPFFDSVIDVSIGIGVDGNFYLTLTGTDEDGIYLFTKKGILEAKVKSISFEKKEDLFITNLSGSIRPLIGEINWPEFDVEKLSIDSKGNVQIDGGWIDVPNKLSFDFKGFKMEVSQVGFGSDEDGDGKYKWIGLSGEIQLVEGIKAGGSVEGLRIKWWDNGKTDIELKGVGVNFEIPDVLKFGGKVAFLSDGVEGFKGDINLNLMCVGLTMDASLMVGKRRVDNRDYKFFYIYLDLELPVGVPLGCSGAGLYGISGLFGYNMEPNKREDQEWYDDSTGWYKSEPLGVTSVDKWRDKEGSIAVGGGITLGTIMDNGYLISAKALVVIVIPGPIIIIEGKANFLKKRSSLSEEGVFTALAVLDNRAGQFLINIEAAYKYDDEGRVLDIHAGAEVFFDYHHMNNWHFYLGEKEPRDKRIRAKIISLFGAEAYFMLEPTRLAWGFWFGFDEKWEFGPVRIVAAAWAEGGMDASWKPKHFWGKAWLHGELGIKIFWFEIGFYIDAGIEGNTPTPYYVLIALKVGINLPWPLPDLEIGIDLKWENKKKPPYPLPLKEVAIGHDIIQENIVLPRGKLLLENYDNGDEFIRSDVANLCSEPSQVDEGIIPVVPLDARPVLTFSRSIWDTAKVGNNAYPLVPEYQKLGHEGKDKDLKDYEYKFELVDITPEKWMGDTWEKVGYLFSMNSAGIIDSLNSGTLPEAIVDSFKANGIDLEEPVNIIKIVENEHWKLADKDGAFSIRKENDTLRVYRAVYGTWLPTEDGEGNPTQTKLQLWTKTPFSYTRYSTRDYEDGFIEDNPNYPCVPEHPVRKICVNFDDVPPRSYTEELGHLEIYKRELEHHGVLFMSPEGLNVVKAESCAEGTDYKNALWIMGARLIITLPEEVYWVSINLSLPAEIKRVLDADGHVINVPIKVGQRRIELGEDSCSSYLAKIKYVGIEFVGNLSCLFEICYLPVSDCEKERVRKEYRVNTQAMVAHWYHEGNILEPYTKYRLAITTKVSVRPNGEPKNICEYAFFRTEGPPGFANLAVKDLPRLFLFEVSGEVAEEIKTSSSGQSISESLRGEFLNKGIKLESATIEKVEGVPGWRIVDREEVSNEEIRTFIVEEKDENTLNVYSEEIGHEHSLDRLNLYVRDTIPQNGQNPFYRAYDMGVGFNQDYVELMYKIVKRDLGIYLFDNDGQPARNAFGRMITLSNAWGIPEEKFFFVPESKYANQMKNAPCIDFDEDSTPPRDLLENSAQGRFLLPRKLYEARVIPMLLHEMFTSRSLEGWSIRNEGNVNAPPTTDNWEILKFTVGEGDYEKDVYYLKQTSNIYTVRETGEPDLPDCRGTYALYDKQEKEWTNYRVTVVLASKTDSTIGIMFRYKDENNYYRFSMDRNYKYRRLIKMKNGVAEILDEDDFVYEKIWEIGFEMSAEERIKTYTVTIEAIDSSIRVYFDGELIFDVEDADEEMSSGKIALYCWANSDARFYEVLVEDLSADALSLYNFQFTTSRYANFFHHIHSFNDRILDPPTLLSNIIDIEKFNVGDYGNMWTIPIPRPENVEIILVKDGNKNKGFLLKSPEPIEWTKRVNLTVAKSDTLTDLGIPSAVKLTSYWRSFSGAYMELLVREDTPLYDWKIEYAEDSENPEWEPFYTFKGLEIFSKTEFSDDDFKSLPGEEGSYFIGGDTTWRNYRLTADFELEGEGQGAGIIFRYKDEKHYYKLAVSNDGRITLWKRVEDEFTCLWPHSDLFGGIATMVDEFMEALVESGLIEISETERRKRYRLTVEVDGSKVTVYFNGRHCFEVDDSEGNIDHGCVGAFFLPETDVTFNELSVIKLEKELFPSGQIIRIYMSPGKWTGYIEDRLIFTTEKMIPKLIAAVNSEIAFRIVDKNGNVIHQRTFLPEWRFADVYTPLIIPSIDGTAALILIGDTRYIEENKLYRFTFTFFREKENAPLLKQWGLESNEIVNIEFHLP